MRLSDPQQPLVQWRSVSIGDLAELVLLDTRYAGRDQQAGDDGTPPLDDPDRSLLGDDQRAFLQERLREAPQPWALVASGVVVNQLELTWPRSMSWMNSLTPNGYAVLDGKVLHDDQWDGYTAERDRLARWLDDRAVDGRRTVILSGDVHSSWAFAGPCRPGDAQVVGIEFTTPAVSSAAMGQAHYPGVSKALDRSVNEMNHVAWAEVTRRGYTVLDITPERVQCEWWFVAPYDEDPAATEHLGAAFTSERRYWPPRLARVEETIRDPDRPGLPQPLPDRPADLTRLRRRRRVRLTAEATVPLLLAAGALALLASRRSRSRS
jgi:alkaline phosphatase D